MKNRKIRILLIVLGCTALFISAVSLGLNITLKHFVADRLNRQLRELYSQTFHYGDIHFRPLRRIVIVTDLYFNSTIHDTLPRDTTGLEVSVKRLYIKYSGLTEIVRNKDVSVKHLSVIEPSLRCQFPFHATPEGNTPLEHSVNAEMETTAYTLQYVARLNVDEVDIQNARFEANQPDHPFYIQADSIDLRLHHLGFDFTTKKASYNDSTYLLSIRNIESLTPDGMFQLNARHIETADAGRIYIRDIRARHIVPKKKLANLSGKIPAIWTDLQLDYIETSPLNIIRAVLNRQVALDTVFAGGRMMEVYEDQRYKPRKPYNMPQEDMMRQNLPLDIHHVVFNMDRMDYTLATTNINHGNLTLKNISVEASRINNRPGNTMETILCCDFPKGGSLDARLRLKMNKNSSFSADIRATGIQGREFDSFMRPLFGITFQIAVDKVESRIQGDRNTAHGDFTLLYHGLEVQAYPGESPYQIISKNAGAINFFSKGLLPKANPNLLTPDSKGLLPSEKVRSYDIAAKRDPMVMFQVYLIATLGDGIKKTLLPGLYISKKETTQKKK